MVIWRIPDAPPPSEHRYKYRLVYGVEGTRAVGFDGERGKGDHKPVDNTEPPMSLPTWIG